MERDGDLDLEKQVKLWKWVARDLALQFAGEMVRPGEELENVAQDYLRQAYDAAVMLGVGDAT